MLAFPNDPLDNRPDRPRRFLDLRPAGLLELLGSLVHPFSDDIHFFPQIDPKKRLGGHRQGQGSHFPRCVNRLVLRITLLPARQHCLGGGDNPPIQRFQPAVLKGRLHQSPLLPPGLALAGHQPIADHLLKYLDRIGLFTVVPVILHQHVPDIIRIVEQVSRIRSRAITDNITVLPGQAKEKVERIAHELAETAARRRRQPSLAI